MQDQKLSLFVTIRVMEGYIHIHLIVFELASMKRRLHSICGWE
jgi:hypothetical protein